METLLKPIAKDIGLTKWWSKVGKVFKKLVDTFDGNPDKRWWSKVLDAHNPWGSGRITYDGWFITDILGISTKKVYFESLTRGFTTVPLTITDGVSTDEATFMGGIAGFRTNSKPDDESAPYVEPVHGWTLLLDRNSVFRKQP